MGRGGRDLRWMSLVLLPLRPFAIVAAGLLMVLRETAWAPPLLRLEEPVLVRGLTPERRGAFCFGGIASIGEGTKWMLACLCDH